MMSCRLWRNGKESMRRASWSGKLSLKNHACWTQSFSKWKTPMRKAWISLKPSNGKIRLSSVSVWLWFPISCSVLPQQGMLYRHAHVCTRYTKLQDSVITVLSILTENIKVSPKVVEQVCKVTKLIKQMSLVPIICCRDVWSRAFRCHSQVTVIPSRGCTACEREFYRCAVNI